MEVVSINKKEILKEVRKIAVEKAENLKYEIVDIEFQKGERHDLLSVFIYKKEGISHEDCKVISEEISEALDEKDFLKDPYYLEISSPGLDRPLKNKDDYRRNLNNEVEVRLYAPIDGIKELIGFLENYDDENVYINVDEEEKKIPIKSISSMKQNIRF